MKISKKIILFVCLVAIIAMVAGCGSRTTNPAGNTATSIGSKTVDKKAALEVVDHKVESDKYSRYITGTVRNNSNKKYSYVHVSINLYDDNGNQVGSTLANLNNLEPGGVWKFKALVIEKSSTKYKIKEVTGF